MLFFVTLKPVKRTLLSMKDCRIETYSVKRNEPHSKYKESFYLYPENDSNGQVVTWKGHFGPFIYTIIQKYHHHQIKEQDVTIEKNPLFKEDPDTHYAFISPKDLADTLNKHLDRIYG